MKSIKGDKNQFIKTILLDISIVPIGWTDSSRQFFKNEIPVPNFNPCVPSFKGLKANCKYLIGKVHFAIDFIYFQFEK